MDSSTIRPDPPPATRAERVINALALIVFLPLLYWYGAARIPSQPAGRTPKPAAAVSTWNFLYMAQQIGVSGPNGLGIAPGLDPSERKFLQRNQASIDRLEQQLTQLQSACETNQCYLSATLGEQSELALLFTKRLFEPDVQADPVAFARRAMIATELTEGMNRYWNFGGYRQDGMVGLLQRVILSEDIPAASLQAWADALQMGPGLRPSAHYLLSQGMVNDLESQLDAHYTRDDTGNGWLVVSSLPQGFPRVANLASICWYDRDAVRRQWKRLLDQVHMLDDERLKYERFAWSSDPNSGDIRAYPPQIAAPKLNVSLASDVITRAQVRSVLVILIDLKQHKEVLGHWPTSAEIDRSNWPTNPETKTPFVYRLIHGFPALPRGDATAIRGSEVGFLIGGEWCYNVLVEYVR